MAVPHLALLLCTLGSASPGLTYFGDVRPMFERSCDGCHSAGVKMGSLDLETWEGVQRGGNNGAIVVPGKPGESRLYALLMGTASPAMPMDGKVLPASQIAVVREWIRAGALPGNAASRPQTPRIYAAAGLGSRVVTGGYERIELLEDGRAVAVATGHAGVVRALAVTKDGALIAAGGGVPGRQGEVKLWAARDGLTFKLAIAGHGAAIDAIAFSPDGQTLATAAADGLIKLWNVATGRERRVLKHESHGLAFAAEGQQLISGGADGTVRVWNAATGEQVSVLGERTEGGSTLALSPDGKLLATTGSDGVLRLWRMGNKGGELRQTRKAHAERVLRLAWSADGGTIASASADQTIKWWRATDLTEIRSMGGQPDWVYGLAFLGDGTLVAGRFDGSLTSYPPGN